MEERRDRSAFDHFYVFSNGLINGMNSKPQSQLPRSNQTFFKIAIADTVVVVVVAAIAIVIFAASVDTILVVAFFFKGEYNTV